jgi:hypothetical protein
MGLQTRLDHTLGITDHGATRSSDGSLTARDRNIYQRRAARETRPSSPILGAGVNQNEDRDAVSNAVS